MAEVGSAVISVKVVLEQFNQLRRELKELNTGFRNVARTLGFVSKGFDNVNKEIEQGIWGFKRWRVTASDFFQLLKAELRWIAGFKILGAIEGSILGFLNSFKELDTALATFRSQTLATKEEVEILRKTLLKVSTEVPYSFRELGNVATVLGRAGLSARQIATLLPSIAKASLVSGEDLTTVGQLLISILATFKASVNDTTDYLNVLVKVLNDTKLDLSDVAASWKYLSAGVGLSKISFKEIITILGLLKDKAQMTGSVLGTTVNRIISVFTQLSTGKVSALQRSFLQQIGITNIREFFDLSKRSLFEILKDLKNKIEEAGYSVEDFAQKFGVSLGERASRSFRILFTNLDDLEKRLKELSTVSPNILTQMTEYALEGLENRWKVTINKLYVSFNAFYTTLKPMLINLINLFSTLIDKGNEFVRSDLFKLALKLANFVLLITFFKNLSKAFQEGATQSGLLATAIATVINKLSKIRNIFKVSAIFDFIKSLNFLKVSLIALFGVFLIQGTHSIKGLIEWLGLLISAILAVRGNLIGLISLFSFLFSKIQEFKNYTSSASEPVKKLGEEIQSIRNIFSFQPQFFNVGGYINISTIKKDLLTVYRILTTTLSPEKIDKNVRVIFEKIQSGINQVSESEYQTIISFIEKNSAILQKAFIKQANDLEKHYKQVKEKLKGTARIPGIGFLSNIFSSSKLQIQRAEQNVKYLQSIKKEIANITEVITKYEKTSRELKSPVEILSKQQNNITGIKKEFDVFLQSVENLKLKVESLNEEWKLNQESLDLNIYSINNLLNVYGKLKTQQEKLVKILKQNIIYSQDKSFQKQIVYIKNILGLDQKRSEILNILNKYLEEHNIKIEGALQLYGKLSRLGLLTENIQKVMVKSITSYIKNITSGKELTSFLKSFVANVNTIIGKELLQANIFDIIKGKIAKLWQEGLLNAKTLLRYKELINTIFGKKAFKDIVDTLYALPNDNLELLIKNFIKLSTVVKPTSENIKTFSENIKQAILSSKNLTDIIKTFQLLKSYQDDLGKIGVNLQKIFKTIDITKLKIDITKDKLTDLVTLTRKFAIPKVTGLYENLSYIKSSKESLIELQRILEASAKSGDKVAEQYLTKYNEFINSLIQESVQAVQNGTLSLEQFFNIWSGFGEYGQKAIESIKEVRSNWDIEIAAMKSAVRDFVNESSNQFAFLKNTFKTLFSRLGNFLGDTVFNIITGNFKNLRETVASFVNELLRMLLQLIAKMALAKAMASIGFATLFAAKGGIFPGEFMPVKAFAYGGIVDRPTIGIVGEGGQPEAVVPLPDGRSIPVKLMEDKTKQSNQNQQAINIVNVVDPKMMGEFLATPMGQNLILNVISNQANKVKKILINS